MPPHDLRNSEIEDGGDVSNRLDFEEPSTDEDWEVARAMTGETPEVRAMGIDELRRMIDSRMELPNRTDEKFLIRFLRARNFNTEKAYNLMARYYKFKELNPTIHKDVYPLRLTHIGDDDVVCVPPYRDQNGHRIIVYRIGNWKPRNCKVEDLLKATVIILELANLEPMSQIKGGVCIFDFSGISLSQICHVTPTVAKQTVALMGGSFPIKIHGIHIVFQSFLFDMVFAVFKPLLDARTREIIYVHGQDMASLHTHIDPKNLPAKYGGARREYSYNDWIETFKKDKTVIHALIQLGYKIDPEDDTENMWKLVLESLHTASTQATSILS